MSETVQETKSPTSEPIAKESFNILSEQKIKRPLSIAAQVKNSLLGSAKSPEEAVKRYQSDAIGGDAMAQYKLGLCQYYGFGIQLNYASARMSFNMAAQKNSDAICYLGHDSMNFESKQAVLHYTEAAEDENAEGIYYLGRCYMEGFLVDKNPVKAAEYFALSAKQGNDEAQRYLDYYNEITCCVKDNPVKVAENYRAQAEKGDATNQLYLGICHELGYGGVEKSDKLAASWYQLSAAQGNAIGQRRLADNYKEGRGVSKNPQEAVKLYALSAQQGDALAQSKLGECYLEDLNPEEAFEWFQLSAEKGNSSGQYNLGKCYENGEGVKKDLGRAGTLYARAAYQGHIEAAYNAGRLYEAKLKNAIIFYTIAAELGHPLSQSRLGKHYQEKRNISEAQKWYSLAAVQGDQKAREALKKLVPNSLSTSPFILLHHATETKGKGSEKTSSSQVSTPLSSSSSSDSAPAPDSLVRR